MMTNNSSSTLWNRVKPYAAIIFLRFGFAGFALITKHALNEGLNHYSFVVYRQMVAFIIFAPFAFVLERSVRPKMTIQIFAKILVLAIMEPVIAQNLFCIGIQYSSATFTAALTNMIPAMTFILAWIFRLEKVNIRSIGSQAKIVGTLVTFGGAMVMTLVRGPIIPTPWNDDSTGTHHAVHSNNNTVTTNDTIKGGAMISIGSVCWALFVILQATTIKSYPAELSLTSLICLVGGVLGSVLAVIMEWGNSSIWSIHLNSNLLAIVYTGFISSGVTFYLQAVIVKTKGPVFVTAFSPLSLVIVAIFSSLFFSEILSLGSLVGALVIVAGLYLVIWGKSKDKRPVILPQPSTEIAKPKENPILIVSEVETKEESV